MSTFSPVVKFTSQTEHDRLAVAAVHALQEQVVATMNTERSRKTTIGISEIGDPCTRCLARKLAQKPDPGSAFNDGWKAQVGTFVHAGLEEHFRQLAQFHADGHQLQVHLERRVTVLDDPRLNLNGSCDIFVTDGHLEAGGTFGLVGDWKVQGQRALTDSQRGKVKPVYRVQGHTYGLGYELLGFPVTHVVLYALPRDGQLHEAAPVVQRYERQVAIDALARVTGLLDAHDILEEAYPGEGWERLIRAQPTASGCYTCRGYDKAETSDFFAWAN